MLASLALRPGFRAAARHHGRRAPRSRPSAPQATWELRSFGAASTAIATGFLLALLYLGQITGMSAGGYEVQRLEAQRDELRRQSALLEIQLTKLDAPARVEARASVLGLVKVGHVPILRTPELAVRR